MLADCPVPLINETGIRQGWSRVHISSAKRGHADSHTPVVGNVNLAVVWINSHKTQTIVFMKRVSMYLGQGSYSLWVCKFHSSNYYRASVAICELELIRPSPRQVFDVFYI